MRSSSAASCTTGTKSCMPLREHILSCFRLRSWFGKNATVRAVRKRVVHSATAAWIPDLQQSSEGRQLQCQVTAQIKSAPSHAGRVGYPADDKTSSLANARTYHSALSAAACLAAHQTLDAGRAWRGTWQERTESWLCPSSARTPCFVRRRSLRAAPHRPCGRRSGATASPSLLRLIPWPSGRALHCLLLGITRPGRE